MSSEARPPRTADAVGAGDDVLQRRLRNAARFSLYLSLALVLLVGTALYYGLRERFRIALDPWYDADFLEYREVRDLQELVRIDTTHESGREMDAARWLGEQLAEAGIEAEIEDMGEGRANLWARIEGRTDETLVLHSHLDTDPVGDLERWSFDPWSGHIDVVWLYARGSFDMKSTIVAQLHAMRSVQRSIAETGRRPRRGLLLLSTSSEETGSHEGAQHIVADHPDLLRGAWALLTEGGVVEAVDANVVKYLGISFGQKRFVDVWYEAEAVEPLLQIARLLQQRGQPARRRVTPSVRRFLEAYAPTRQLEETRALADPDGLVASAEAFERLPDFYKALFRDEIHALAPRQEDGVWRMRVVLSMLEDSTVPELLPLVPDAAELPEGVTRRVDASIGSMLSSPLDHPAYLQLTDRLGEEVDPDRVGPYYLAHFANDAQFFRKLGIPSYGFQPFLAIPADSYTVGTLDERIALPTFIEGVRRYTDIVHDLVAADRPSTTDDP